MDVWSGGLESKKCLEVIMREVFIWTKSNCGLNHFYVNFPYTVSLILFIVVLMKRLHGIFKDPHSDGSPVYWRFWSTDKTHHLVLILQVMPSYCSTVPIYKRTELICNLHCFGGEVVILLNICVLKSFNECSILHI